ALVRTYPQPPETNVKWFSVASPEPAGNFTDSVTTDTKSQSHKVTENAVSPLLLRARGQLG
ncbi:MAG: hypothetical protein ACK55Z_17780, partial [bacterium]